MGFNVWALLCTIGCCLISILIAGTSASKKENQEWFANLDHPDNAFMIKFMNSFGFVFYLLFGFVLYHLFADNAIAPIVVAVVVVQLMGLSPYFLYKTKKLRLFFFASLIFLILIPLLILLLLQTNPALAIPVILYFLWLIYDLSYWYRLMKMNT